MIATTAAWTASARHMRAARSTVDYRAGRQGEQQPGQEGRGGHDGDQPRVPGDGHGQQRQRGHERAVAVLLIALAHHSRE